jgi:solute carrier family 30 (zinc transporter), member 2
VEIGPLYDVHLDVASSPSAAKAPHTRTRAGERVASSVCGGLHNATAEEVAHQMSSAKKKLAIVATMCLMFMVGEVVGGLYANSLAILTDAAHLLSDLAGFLISLFAVWLSNRTPTARLSFGFYRAEILGALTSVMMIWFVTGILLYEAVQRVLNPVDVDGRLMFIIASVGLCVNGAMGMVLHSSGIPHGHGHGHGHAHGHAHADGDDHGHAHGQLDGQVDGVQGLDDHQHAHAADRDTERSHKPAITTAPARSEKPAGQRDHMYTKTAVAAQPEEVIPGTAISVVSIQVESADDANANQQPNSALATPRATATATVEASIAKSTQFPAHVNVNIRAAFIHVLGDALQSVGVMLAAALIWAHPDWHIADPICTFVFCVVVLSTTLGLVRQCVNVLMEASPDNVDSGDVEQQLRQLPGVADVHDLHIWSLTVGKPSLTAHIAVQGTSQGVLQAASQLLASRYNIHHVTIQVELTQDRVRCNPGCQVIAAPVLSAPPPAAASAEVRKKDGTVKYASKSNPKAQQPMRAVGYYL